jgi:NTP pyrophosphatase (non-canonical NTP hydrolase)
MTDATTTIEQLKDQMRRFVAERDWEQFHDLKNLSMAVAVEAGELMDHFRWVDNKAAAGVMEGAAQAAAVRHEVADVFLLLLDFAIMANIDLAAAAVEKLELNRRKYPVATAKGSSRKHRGA